MSHYVRKFNKKVEQHRSRFRRFLTGIDKNPPKQLDQYAEVIDREVWSEVDFLAWYNCCRTMSPTFNTVDIRRISAHLNMTSKLFKG